MTSPPAPWSAALRSVVASVEASDVRELEVRIEGFRIRLRRASFPSPVAVSSTRQPKEEADDGRLLRCPITGIWYDAPSPGASPFVAVGDAIEVGTTVGLVETMKVFNEVSSELSGIVREILVRRGDLVAAHAPIMVIEPATSDGAVAASDLG